MRKERQWGWGDIYGATKLTSGFYPHFLSLHMDGDETLNMMVMCARTLSTASQFYTATKILQEIHAIKTHILVCVINVKYPSLMQLTVHLILKAELIYASIY